ncbi:MAG: tryptophanase [Chitinispirillia bacterium]|nr:tryptophanase [Chitinispirillia bacterium]MCL2268525.1 tryptophanase [Chitinispirillia bacterium]
MANVKFYAGESFPLEMHKVRIIQKLNLIPIEERGKAIAAAGNNTFLLQNRDVFMDMLTDSGVNAMSDRQLASMMYADDSYAGSETFTRLERSVKHFFGCKHFLPAHQGRACENILSKTFVTPGSVVPMNYHFTTAKALITLNGGTVEELIIDEGLKINSANPFKGNIDIDKLNAVIKQYGVDKVAYVRMEAGTNLVGGQPFSLENYEQVSRICRTAKIPLVLDASLLADNLYFNKKREAGCKYMTLHQIVLRFAELSDIIYFSARKLGFARGGGICTNNDDIFMKLRELVPLFEGFLTYGGMSVREMEAIAVGLEETLDEDMISQGPIFIDYMVKELDKRGIPVITPPGGLGCHVDAGHFLDHIPQSEYPAGALASAFYIASGIRGMERGTLSEQREPDGSEHYSNMELLRLALPRRVFTLSQVNYAIDRLIWLHENRKIVGGLKFVEEPKILRFFFGRLDPVSDWQTRLVTKFRQDFGDSL